MNDMRVLWLGVTAVFLFVSIGFATAQETTPPATPPSPNPTPTVDRLAAPPTVPSPTQADEGAQLYWLYCQPCHGDQGQGLTDEWRAQYPPEEQNCWQSGCHGTHGKDAPEDGFVLPTAVPALIGQNNNLSRFGSMAQLYQYTRSKMPYAAPGSLDNDEYFAIMAFLARAHGIWDGIPINANNIDQLRWKVSSNSVQGNKQPNPSNNNIHPSETPSHQETDIPYPTFLVGSGIAIFFLVGSAWLWRRFQR